MSASHDMHHYMPQTNLLQTVEGTHAELFQYDADGNTTLRTPGANNPVPSITDPADYTYNAGGQRLLKQNTSDRIFHYDLDGRLIEETDGLGNLIKGYIWLNGQPLARFDAGGAVYYYHNDHLGTPQRMTDAGANVVWAADYLPFGKADVTLETVGNDLRFAGQYYDHETGLHYNYNRYYDPSLGRYLRADPIGLAGGINPYVYVQNDPINAIDPLGLEDRSLGRSSIWLLGPAASSNRRHDPDRKSPGLVIKVKIPDFNSILAPGMKDVDSYLHSDHVEGQFRAFSSILTGPYNPSPETAIGANYDTFSLSMLKSRPRVLVIRGLISVGMISMTPKDKYEMYKMNNKVKECNE